MQARSTGSGKALTRRELLTAAAYGDPDQWPTQAQLAARFGVGRTAIAMRLCRAMAKLTADQAQALRRRTRIGYRRALVGSVGRRIRMVARQIEFVK